jgi:hypothetical protein
VNRFIDNSSVPCRRSVRDAVRRESSEENKMNDLDTEPGVQENIVGVFFTCVVCGTVEEIHVPREEGLPPKVYWECVTCQMRADGDGRIGLT